MITQIYSIRTAAEALAVIDAGADHIGVVPWQERQGGVLTGSTTEKDCEEICAAARGKAKLVFLSTSDDEQFYFDMARRYHPDIIHVTGNNLTVSEPFCRELKRLAPGLLVMQAVPMSGPEAVELAKKYAKIADLLILDTVIKGAPEVGAAGITHDWELDRKIVETVDVPVIIAGGLGPENVADAIRAIRPWGVDSLTKTDRFLPDGTRLREKDLEKVRRFCLAAKGAQ